MATQTHPFKKEVMDEKLRELFFSDFLKGEKLMKMIKEMNRLHQNACKNLERDSRLSAERASSTPKRRIFMC